jgi:hypothetical protein
MSLFTRLKCLRMGTGGYICGNSNETFGIHQQAGDFWTR